MTVGTAVVLGITLLALILFATEIVPLDITAIGIMVLLILLEPWTKIGPEEGISGFSNPATITVLAMFILSEGIRRTGAIQVLGRKLIEFTRGSIEKNLGAIGSIVIAVSGFLNNTGVVAVLLPMVSDLANKVKISPSKLLIPLSYASMFGGMLTVVGTSTNLLASDLSERLLDHRISMFEFAPVGLIISALGLLYLVFVCHRLLPSRIDVESDLTQQFEVSDYLTEVRVPDNSPLANRKPREAIPRVDFDLEILQVLRGEDTFQHNLENLRILPGDVLIIETDRTNLMKLLEEEGVEVLEDRAVDEQTLEAPEDAENLFEVVLAPRSRLAGETLKSSRFRNRYQGTVLAIRHGNDIVRDRVDELTLRVGDALLVQAPSDTVKNFETDSNFILSREIHNPNYRKDKIFYALGIILGVVLTATFNVLSILTAALAGSLMMVVSGCLKPGEIYDAVHWDIIFLLAGLIPLGKALEHSGSVQLLSDGLLATSVYLNPLLVMILLYLISALLTNIISNNASVLLMIPIAIEVAVQLGVNPFAYLLTVTFAASTAFATPMGYQTNLFVYGPGGYRFSDYLVAGLPLQLIFSIATPLSIAYFWPL